MRKLVIVSGFICGILAVIIGVTPLYKLSIIPSVIAIICLGVLWYITKKNENPSKFIQYIGILIVIAISMSIYKTVFNNNELQNTEELELKEEESVDDSIEILEDLDIEE